MKVIHSISLNPETRSRARRRTTPQRRSGFSITELLVVVGIIALLASLLLVAMGRVRTTAMQSRTLSTMQNFAAACDAFQTEHGQYPGVIPERVLAQHDAQLDGEQITFTSTENALLHLMGGYRVLPPGITSGSIAQEFEDYEEDYLITIGDWSLKIKLADIGQGPVINGRPHAPYYTPGAREVLVADGQWNPATNEPNQNDVVRIMDLVDAWGQPIIYIRQIRTSGELVGEVDQNDRAQFLFGNNNSTRFAGMTGYLLSTRLGDQGQDQVEYSILNRVPESDRMATFAQLIRHPAFGVENQPLEGTSRGAYVLISAGPDGVFFSREDGPGEPNNPVDDITQLSPRIVDDYDDIIFFGGG